MPRPSACGYPDATNTGVPAGTALTARGGLTITAAGTYADLDVRGCVFIGASNVTLTRSRVQGCAGDYAVRIGNGRTGVVVSDVEVVMQGDQKGISLPWSTGAFTVTRAYVHGIGDCFGNTDWTEIRDSFCILGPAGGDTPRAPTYGREPSWCGATGAHWDGAELGATRHTVFHHNTVRNPCGQTAAVGMSSWNGPMNDVKVTDNLLAGGAYTVYVEPAATNIAVTGNRFSRWYWPWSGSAQTSSQACIVHARAGMLGASVWDETGAAVG